MTEATAQSTAPTDVAALRRSIEAQLPGVRADLEALVRIPSVSADAFDQAPRPDGRDGRRRQDRGDGARRGPTHPAADLGP